MAWADLGRKIASGDCTAEQEERVEADCKAAMEAEVPGAVQSFAGLAEVADTVVGLP